MWFHELLKAKDDQDALLQVRDQLDSLSRGMYYHLLDYRAKATHYYLKAAKEEPVAYRLLAELYQDDPPRFLKYVELAKQHEDSSIYGVLGEHYQKQGDHNKAIIAYEEGAKKKQLNCIRQLAKHHVERNKEESLRLYSLGQNLGDPECSLSLADALLEADDRATAFKIYREAIKAKWPRAQYHLGMAYYQLKRYKEAVRELDKGAKQDDLDCILFLANYHNEKGNLALQEKYLTQAVELEHFEAYHLLGDCLIELRRYHEAVRTFQKGVRVFPSDQRNYESLGDYYENIEDHPDEAIYWYEEGVKQGSVSCMMRLGNHYENQDPVRDHEAIRWYLRALEAGSHGAQHVLLEYFDRFLESPDDYLFEIHSLLRCPKFPAEEKENLVNRLLLFEEYGKIIDNIPFMPAVNLYDPDCLECPVCYETLPLTILHCGHGYCKECFEQLIEQYSKCAMCKQVIC